MSDYIEVLDETDPRSNLDGDTLIHTDINVHLLSTIINVCNFTLTFNTILPPHHA